MLIKFFKEKILLTEENFQVPIYYFLKIMKFFKIFITSFTDQVLNHFIIKKKVIYFLKRVYF